MATLPTTTSKGKVKPVRTVKLQGRILTLTEGEQKTSFHLTELSTGLTSRCFRLEKFAADQRGDGDDQYDVVLGEGVAACTCKGHERWVHRGTICRHRAALTALLARGRLEDLDTVVCGFCRGHGREANGYGRGCGHCRGSGRLPTL